MRIIMRAAGASMATLALLLPLGAAASSDETVAWQPESESAQPAFADTESGAHAAATEADALFGRVISDGELASQRGGDVHVNENNATGVVQDNVARNLTTGNNTITESAFANSAGIPMVIQNSGNNVLIQNSTILNLQLQ